MGSSKMAGGQLSDTEKSFVQEAIEGGRHEVEMGKMAAKQGGDASVKAYGKKLVSDHTTANKKLEAIAKKNGVTTTKSSSASSDSDLMAAKGADFDKIFAAKAVEDHQKDIAKFEAAEKDATNPDLKSFISSTLPTLRDHLQQAQSLNMAGGSTSGASSSGSSAAGSSSSGSSRSTGSSSGSSPATPGNSATPHGTPGSGTATPGSSTNPGSATSPTTPQR